MQQQRIFTPHNDDDDCGDERYKGIAERNARRLQRSEDQGQLEAMMRNVPKTWVDKYMADYRYL
jgi:hypothetical protein